MSAALSPMPTQEKLRLRHAAHAAIRAFFTERGYLEVDTALLTSTPGLEPHIDPIAVDLRTGTGHKLERRWLVTSAELQMKKLLAQGADKIFQLSHVFRDGEDTARHRPEFTMLEWYCVRASLDDLVQETAELIRAVSDACDVVPANRPPTDVYAPFERKSVCDLFLQYAEIDLHQALADMRDGDDLALQDRVRALGMSLRENADFEDAFFHVMLEKVEPNIGRRRPTVVDRWPSQLAALAKRCADDPLVCERFEVYAGGLELCNAYDELTDVVEQRMRFTMDNEKREALGKPALPVDHELLRVLPQLPQTVGNALGVDRLLMLLTGATDIREVTL